MDINTTNGIMQDIKEYLEYLRNEFGVTSVKIYFDGYASSIEYTQAK